MLQANLEVMIFSSDDNVARIFNVFGLMVKQHNLNSGLAHKPG
jgi:hypothetical protein